MLYGVAIWVNNHKSITDFGLKSLTWVPTPTCPHHGPERDYTCPEMMVVILIPISNMLVISMPLQSVIKYLRYKPKSYNEWPLQLPSRLNPLDTGGKYCNKNLPGERSKVEH